MYNETEYIFREFQRNFAGKKNEPLVLYGIGRNTERLLPKIQEYTIAGLMDGNRKSGTLWGKPVLDYCDVLRLRVKTIIVIARPAVIGVIYHRIAEFCTRNGITVYDIKGNDLSKKYIDQENDFPYFHQSFRKLEETVRTHRIISFDIFDTLVMRKVLYPADIFAIMEREISKKANGGLSSFASLRREAEERLYREGKNPNLEEIYACLQEVSGISAVCRENLMAREIAMEMKFLTPRKRMLELYNKIRGEKEIYLISDMYLPRNIIEKILDICGYKNYSGLYISCEKRTAKNEELFELFAREMEEKGYSRRECLHIGDNYTADIMGAQAAGMDAFQILSARELLESSSYRSLLTEKLNYVDRLALGLLCEKAFNDPFALWETKGKLRICGLREFAYMLVAPMVVYFSLWLMRQVCRYRCDYILYPSRDAWLIEKICQMVYKTQSAGEFPAGEYFYASRRAVLAAAVRKDEDIKRIAEMDFCGSIGQMFLQRFNVSVEGKEKDVPVSDRNGLERCLKRYGEKILRQCGKERQNYLRYISETGIPTHNRIAFVDFVAAGKIQNGVEKLVEGKEFLGFYFLRREPDKDEIDREIHVKSFYPSKGAFEIDLNVYKYYLFLEMILTSPEPTFCSVADDGEILFLEETRSDGHRNIVKEIQEGILAYGEELAGLYPDLLSDPVNRDIPDAILGFLDRSYTDLDLPDMTALVLTDEFLGQAFNIFQS